MADEITYEVVDARDGGLVVKYKLREYEQVMWLAWDGTGDVADFVSRQVPFFQRGRIPDLKKYVGRAGYVVPPPMGGYEPPNHFEPPKPINPGVETMADMDFPLNPFIGQNYTNSIGVVYQWNGYGWVIGFYDSTTETFQCLGDLLDMIRVLLQDTDTSGGEYRYSTDSIVANINMGFMEMLRIRPDIFLEMKFKVPVYNDAQMDALITIEPQHVPALIYYAVGMTQLRDDEGTQDARASGFLAKFTSMLVSVA